MLRRILRLLSLAAAALSLCGCATPLGPGFHTEKELLEVRFVPGSPPHLEIRATFTLKNSGNAPLDALELSLPDEKFFGLQNLRIEMNGAAVSAQPSAAAPAASSGVTSVSAVRVPLASPWPQKAVLTLTVSYDIRRLGSDSSRLGLDVDSFFLSTDGWHPLPLAPKGLFAKGNERPKRFDLSVRVPDGFLVHAAGRPRGKKRRAAESEFRFRIAEDDFAPFIVSGRYHEQKFSDSSGTVLFWTRQPLPADQVARAGPRLIATAHIFEKLFGPIYANKRFFPLWIVETPFPPVQESSTIRVVHLGHAPAAARLSSAAFADGVGSGVFLDRVERAWSANWPWYVAKPAPGTDDFLGDALREYAGLVAQQARRGEPARVAYAGGFLNSYDAACQEYKEIPIALLERKDYSPQQRIAESKLALFLLALENEVGSERLHLALRSMIQGLRGRTYAFTDFRVALEAESGKDLGEFFRLWLNHPGIPADFRARYADQKSREQK